MMFRLRLLGSWSLNLSLIFLSALACRATEGPPRAPIPAEVTQMAGYPFPVKVAKFSRGLQHFYRSGLGFSVTYKMYGRPGETSAEIYIYDLGRDLTSADPVKASADQRDAALSDIQAEISAARDHIAARISKTDEGPFAKAHLTLTQMGKTWDEYIFVTVKNNRFVKIRVKSSSDNAARLADRFAAEYARLLSQ